MTKIRTTKKTGRPSISTETKDLVWKLYNEDEMTCAEIAKTCNIGVSSLYNIINERRAKDGD